MSNNIDRAIKARMKKYNETRSTARRHVLAGRGGGSGRADGDGGRPHDPQSRVRGIVEGVIAIADRQTRERQQGREEPIYQEDRRDPLRGYLSALVWADLRKVEILMYAGREGDHLLELGADLKVEAPHITVGIIAGKSLALAKYLRRGLSLAEDQRVDLDGKWPEPSVPAGDFIKMLGEALVDLAHADGPTTYERRARVDMMLRYLSLGRLGYASEKVAELRGYADHAAGRRDTPNVGGRAGILPMTRTAIESLVDALRRDGVERIGWVDSL